MKRLLQVCCYQQPQFTCGALILLSEVLKDKPGLLSLSHVEEVRKRLICKFVATWILAHLSL